MGYLMSMWRALGVGFWACAIILHASLSSYAIVAEHCGTPRSHMMLLQYKYILPITAASMYSASVDDIATVGSNPALYPTAPPATIRFPPPIDRRVIGHVAHSASMYPCISVGPWMGRPSSRRSCMLLLILGGGTAGSLMFGCALQ